jgi:ATP-dependent protease HslVU (ClpYQ) peptidase subunit
MTTVAAIQGPTWVAVGADSHVQGEDRTYILPGDSAKIFDNNGYTFGVAGDLRAINILRHSFTPPPPDKNRGISLDKFMVSKFMPALKVSFERNFYGTDRGHGNNLLVVVNAVAYEVGDNYDLIRDDVGLYALGSGGPYALGALTALSKLDGSRTMKRARENLEAALFAATTLDPGSSQPATIYLHKWKVV